MCAPDLGVGDDGWQHGDDVGGRPGGRGRSRLEVEARERGRRCWSWSRRAVLWRWRGCRRCRGSVRLGDGQPVENAPGHTCSRLPAPVASRSWRAFSSATWVRTQLGQRHPEAHHALDGPSVLLALEVDATSASRAHDTAAKRCHGRPSRRWEDREANARVHEHVKACYGSMPAASGGGRGGERRGDRCDSAHPRVLSPCDAFCCVSERHFQGHSGRLVLRRFPPPRRTMTVRRGQSPFPQRNRG